jgi:predicted alpha/beta-hydrolase family hydrolase
MAPSEPFLDTSTADLPVRGFLHRASNPLASGLVLTHGAGSNCQATLLIALAEVFCAAGLTVLRCDLAFRQSRPTGPPPRGSADRDQTGLRAAVASIRRETRGRIFLGGHSYGGRQASMLAASDPAIAEALLLLSYPLHPPKRPTELRTSHFPDLTNSSARAIGPNCPSPSSRPFFLSFDEGGLPLEENLVQLPGFAIRENLQK